MEERQDKRSHPSPPINSSTWGGLSQTAEWAQLLLLLTLRSVLPSRGDSSLPGPGALSYQLTWMEEIRKKLPSQAKGHHMIKQTQKKKKKKKPTQQNVLFKEKEDKKLLDRGGMGLEVPGSNKTHE